MAKMEDYIGEADKKAKELLKDVEEHRIEVLKGLPAPINATQATLQALKIDNGWLIQKLANYEVVIMDFNKRLIEMELFYKSPLK